MAKVEVSRNGRIAVLTMVNSPVNALAHGVRIGLVEAVRASVADPEIDALVVTGAGRAFSAGADIAEFRAGLKEPGLGAVIDAIEACPKLVVAAINGLALGGGLEVALGCHYRIASAHVRQLGLPEVKIGILPGAGGTQRLPRLVGVAAALDMIVSGNPIDVAVALKAGLVDRVVDGDVVAASVAFAGEILATGKGPRPTSRSRIDPGTVPAGLFDSKREDVARHASGPLAARHCIAAVEAAVGSDYRTGVAREWALFQELAASPFAKALQYAFFAERKAGDIPDIGRDVKPRDIRKVGVVGAGTMGTGIALAVLNAGLPVTIVETTQEALDRGLTRIGDSIASAAKRGRMSEADAANRLAALTGTTDMTSLGDVDLAIEAVFERLAVKEIVFRKLDAIAKPGAVLATNTSTLDVDRIAAVTARPQDVVGMHFFSPANIMRLLEIVRGRETAKDTVATALAFARGVGKVGVVAGVCFGFIGNRMIEAYLEEAQAMLLEGATPAEIDGAIEAWGLAMGPNAMMDLAGIDVGYMIRQEHPLSNARRQLYRATDRLSEMGRHGQKTGAGYYRYGTDRKRSEDPEVAELFAEEAARLGITRNPPRADAIVERLLLRLANEGANILAEGIALRASDIDTIYLTGYGFPGWRGGPMWHIENVMGLSAALDRIRHYERLHGPRWAPAPLLERLGATGGTLADAGKTGAQPT